MKRTLLASAVLALATTASAFAQTEIREYGCALMSGDGGGAAGLPGYSVLEETREDGMFSIGIRADFVVTGIICRRNTLVPAEYDYEVTFTGYPLYIAMEGDTGDRIGALTIEDDQFVFHVVQGELTEAERAAVAARLESYYAMVNDES